MFLKIINYFIYISPQLQCKHWVCEVGHESTSHRGLQRGHQHGRCVAGGDLASVSSLCLLCIFALKAYNFSLFVFWKLNLKCRNLLIYISQFYIMLTRYTITDIISNIIVMQIHAGCVWVAAAHRDGLPTCSAGELCFWGWQIWPRYIHNLCWPVLVIDRYHSMYVAVDSRPQTVIHYTYVLVIRPLM